MNRQHFRVNDASKCAWGESKLNRVQRAVQNVRPINPQPDSDDEESVELRFVSQLPDEAKFNVNQRAHIDCTMDPALLSDDSLTVQWLMDGQPVVTNNRLLTSTSAFGTHTLEILGVKASDSGVYECRLLSSKSQVSTQCRLHVAGGETNGHVPDTGATGRYVPENINEEESNCSPKFTEPLPESLLVEEGEPLRLQTTLTPANDPLLKTEWLINGKPLSAGSRLSTFYDFGLVTLSILDARAEDSGVFTCRANNALGEAETSCTITCSPRGKSLVKPMFQSPLVANPNEKLEEGDFIHFETRLEPRNDPYVNVEWLHDGKTIQTGQRLVPHYDFGIATLDIMGVYPEDAGKWTVKASNSLGLAEAEVELSAINPKDGIQTKTQHPEAHKKIAELEFKDFTRTYTYNDDSAHEPKLGQTLPPNLSLDEGQPVFFSVTVEPKNDPNMQVEWTLNGKIIENGHRVRHKFEFGLATLQILETQPRDSGVYICRFQNPLGSVDTQSEIQVTPKEGIISSAQHEASLEKIKELESYENAPGYFGEDFTDKRTVAPSFVKSLDQVPELREGENMHLEAILQPSDDSTLKVEWFFNGQSLRASNRIQAKYDFGCVQLDLLQAIPEDSGQYMLKISNECGEISEAVNLVVKGRSSIISDAQAPHFEKIQELEDMLNYKPPEIADEKKFEKPYFTSDLSGPEKKVKEGSNVHFECSVQPLDVKVEWYKDDKPLQHSSRYKFVHDLDYVALDIIGAYPRDEGIYTVKAINTAGDAVSSMRINCSGKRDVVIESQNPRSLRKIQELESWNY